MTVPHAPAAVRTHAHYVTTREGGSGAVRELADIILLRRGAATTANRATRNGNRRSSWRGKSADALAREFIRLMYRTREILDRLVAWAPVLLLGALAALTYWLDAQVQPPAALAGFAGHAVRLEVDWPVLAVSVAAAVPGAWLGARLTGRMSERTLKRGIGAALVGVGLAIGVEAAF